MTKLPNSGLATEWAEFFVRTCIKNKWDMNDIDEDLMIVWFANAMEDMRINIHKQLEIEEKELYNSFMEALSKNKVVFNSDK